MSTTEFTLNPVRGDNPLGFLAAVGLLRVAGGVWPGARLRWELAGGEWRAAVSVAGACDEGAFVERVHAALPPVSAPAEWADVPVTADAFRAGAAGRDPGLSVLGTEGHVDDPDENVAVTRFKLGAGQQKFLGQMRELAAGTTAEQVRAALFADAWGYRDPAPSLRWDPIDDRRYALRAADPAGSASPIRAERGAYRLAVEALRFFPVVPARRGAETRGFARDGDDTVLTWPVWADWLTPAAVRTLVGSPELLAARPDPGPLRALGVREVFRSVRTTAYYSNLLPARAVWGAGR